MGYMEHRAYIREELNAYAKLLEQNEAFADRLQAEIAKFDAGTPDEVGDRVFAILEQVKTSIEIIKYRISLMRAVLKMLPLTKVA